MMRIRFLFLVLLAISGPLLLPACQATPPIVGPNGTPGDDDDRLSATPPTVPVPEATPDGASDTDNTEDGAPTDPVLTPGIAIESASGAFAAGESVRVGLDLADEFDGIAPQLGALAGVTSSDLAEEILITADATGAITCGIYLFSSTTPGTYTLFAESADTGVPHYLVTITITE